MQNHNLTINHWSPLTSNTNINKLQIIQNVGLRVATGTTADTNTQHLYVETQVIPILNYLNLHTSNLLDKATNKSHPLNKLVSQPTQDRLKKATVFLQNNESTQTLISKDQTGE